MFSIIGSLVLSASLGISVLPGKLLVRIAGILMLWVGFVYLCYHPGEEMAKISFISGLPFLLLSTGILIQSLIMLFKKEHNE
ncbi:MAG TPA: hypothetical protein VG738_18345 [Chitinophagaceae bacterium]|nr:hypothetical protein [Chitinophagaceae bacterium]